MHNASGSGASIQSDSQNDGYRAIASDLVSLIEHVQTSIKLIESAIERELPLGNQEIGANVVILDDVTPRYVKASAALNACNAGLGVALHFLLDTRTSRSETEASAGSAHRPLRLAGRD